MKSFLRTYFAALLAGGTFFALGFLLLLFSGNSKDTSVEDDSTLRIVFSGNMVDRAQRPLVPGLEEILGTGISLSMEEIVFNIRKAARDPKIESLFLDLGFFTAGSAQLREIRQAIGVFQDSGKVVYAYGSILTRPAYYLGSVADSLLLDPQGVLEWNGLSSSRLYLKGGLDKLGVKMELIRGSDNAYKSAGEPFIAESMSDANREQLESYLNSVWNDLVADLSNDDRLSAETLHSLAGQELYYTAEEALSLGFVDRLLFEDEMLQKFSRDGDITDMHWVGLDRYDLHRVETASRPEGQVAVIYAEGEVGLGNSSAQNLGSETIVRAIRNIRTNDRIDAVVLRINSPGGVSIAGDAMWREVELLNREKPVVVSMGNVAASAGYLIAAPTDYIFAQPQTITGSIGVFMTYPVATELLNDKLGLSFQTVSTHAFGQIGVPDHPLTDEEKGKLQENVDRVYTQFRNHVADGRGLSREHVDSLAKGRVWTGTQAAENGLVDELGGLIDAIDKAKELAGLSGPARLSTYPVQKDPLTEFLNTMGQSRAAEETRNQLGPFAPLYDEWTRMSNYWGLQKRLEFYSMNSPL